MAALTWLEEVDAAAQAAIDFLEMYPVTEQDEEMNDALRRQTTTEEQVCVGHGGTIRSQSWSTLWACWHH